MNVNFLREAKRLSL